MRYAELVLDPGPGGFHPADRRIIDSPEIERVAIQHFNQLDDGTIVFLYQLRGDPDEATAVLEAHADVLAHSVAGEDDDIHAYIHVDPNETVETVFRLPQEHSLVVETPIECLPGGAIRVSVLGDQATFTEALDVVPEALTVELETIRDYAPGDRQLYSTLTERQREILRTAIAAGYYDVPREATYEDVAARLDLAPVTVGEHLRKIEAEILTAVAPAAPDDE
jgi:predicted DNA binding protein